MRTGLDQANQDAGEGRDTSNADGTKDKDNITTLQERTTSDREHRAQAERRRTKPNEPTDTKGGQETHEGTRTPKIYTCNAQRHRDD